MPLDLFGDFGIVGGSNTAPDPYQDKQLTINWYPEVATDRRGAKTVTALLGAPGLIQVAAAPGGGAPGFSSTQTLWPQPSSITNLPVRAMWVLPGETQALVVIASTLYLCVIITYGSRTTPGVLSLTSVGSLASSAGVVKIRDNGAQGGTALITDGANGYTYQWQTNTFAQVTSADFLGAGSSAFIDGWFALGSNYVPNASSAPLAVMSVTSGEHTNALPFYTLFGYASGVMGTLNSSTTLGTVTAFYTTQGVGGSPTTVLTISVGSDPTQAYFSTIQSTLGTLQSFSANYSYSGGVSTWSWPSTSYWNGATSGAVYAISLLGQSSGSALFYTPSNPYSTAWNASYYAFKDAFSDELVALMEMKELLWLIGEQTTEPWYNAGAPYFTFQRLSGAMLQVGSKAPYSIARITVEGTQDGLIWLGRSDRGENIVVLLTGLTYRVVSTPALSDAIANYVTTSDAIGYTYQEDGHEFYMLTFPTQDVTWCFDASVPLEMAWTQRLSYDPYAQSFHRHRSNCYMNFGGMRIVGDYQNGALYQMTRAVQNDAGWPLRSIRRSPHIWKKESRTRIFMSSLQLDFAPGQGNASGMGSNPQSYLRISRDGGTTFGQRWPQPMGQIGQYQNRCMYRRLGFSRDMVLELEVIDPVNRDLVGSTLMRQDEWDAA